MWIIQIVREKQRKMEERENRREKKKAQPKMKQLKVN